MTRMLANRKPAVNPPDARPGSAVRDGVDVAAQVHDVELARRALAEAADEAAVRGAGERDPCGRVRPSGADREDLAAAVVAKHVPADERGDGLAPVHVAAGDRTTPVRRVRVLG